MSSLHCSENVSGISEIQPVIDRIDTALARPIALADGEVVLSVSVGVAEASDEHRSPEDLLQDADRAMYATKRAYRGRKPTLDGMRRACRYQCCQRLRDGVVWAAEIRYSCPVLSPL